MNRDPHLDFFTIRPEHIPVHDRLSNWAAYVKDRPSKIADCAMFRQYKPYLVPREPSAAMVDMLDGHAMEKAVSALPQKHRDAIRWTYVFYLVTPSRMCQHLGVSRQGLALLIHDARSMLKNRSR